MKEKFGEKITVTDANKYFKAYGDIKEEILDMPAIARPGTIAASRRLKIEMTNNYQTSKINAFIFKKELVYELLAMADKSKKNPDYLMIHFAAKIGGKFKKGEPTLVLLGCNKNGKNYISMKNVKPAGETPGLAVVAKFPAKKKATVKAVNALALSVTAQGTGDTITFTPL